MLLYACLVLFTFTAVSNAGIVNVGKSEAKYKYLQTDKCTSIALGAKATIDGSTITTHNNDCQECDFRITHVPARDWPAGSKRPLYDIRNAYPRYIEVPESKDGNIHGPDYIKSTNYPDKSIFNWNTSSAIGYIDQVPHTYGYTLGTYAIQNEKQVSIGESTCSSKFVAKPVYAEGGHALMHMETLTELALERCDTARCAIQTMGDLAEKYGFYGPEWAVHDENAEDESGEALTVSDKNEAWMFHVMPDDSGASAIWVAQRVPDDHITVVANQFVIGEINVADTVNFMASSNILAVAERNNLWSSTWNTPFHFSRVYGNDRKATGFMCTRRMWRVFTLAAPSLKKVISPFTDGLATFGYGEDLSQPYPFSVKVDTPLSVQDIFNMNRDQFEGTLFDLTSGIDSGLFGDPMRFGPIPDWQDKQNGLSWEQYSSGVGYERPISLWRTAYSSVTQSRKQYPDAVGAVAWIAQYAPHHSTFAPVYAAADKTPSSLNRGTQYKVDKKANWWVHCITGNYLSRWYKFTIKDVVKFQKKLETTLFTNQVNMEREAIVIATLAEKSQRFRVLKTLLSITFNKFITQINKYRKLTAAIGVPRKPKEPKEPKEPKKEKKGNGDKEQPEQPEQPEPANDFIPKEPLSIGQYLTNYHEEMSQYILDEWWDFFFKMAGTYRDMYKVVDTHTENFARSFKYVGVPKWWYESTGFWGVPGTAAPGSAAPSPVGRRRYTFPSEGSIDAYKVKYPSDFVNDYAFYGINASFSMYGDEAEPFGTDPLNAVNPMMTPISPQAFTLMFGLFFGLVVGILATLGYLRYIGVFSDMSTSYATKTLPGGPSYSYNNKGYVSLN